MRRLALPNSVFSPSGSQCRNLHHFIATTGQCSSRTLNCALAKRPWINFQGTRRAGCMAGRVGDKTRRNAETDGRATGLLQSGGMPRRGVERRARFPKPRPSPLPRDKEALLGWPMVLESSGRRVGFVEEIIYNGNGSLASDLMRVVNEDVDAGFGEGAREEHLIPLVPQIVVGADYSLRVVALRPPKGLLRLGRQRMLTAYLEPLLLEVAKAVSPNGATRMMPTRVDLVEAGRGDLIRIIIQAGGFLNVADRLGWRTKRRPVGFWDNIDNLDQELTAFVAAHWMRFKNEDGIPYYFNRLTERVSWHAPQEPTRMELDDSGSYLLVEDEQDRVMPSRLAVQSAGRYDLHRAIMFHGGYREVSQTLGRASCWPRPNPLRNNFPAIRQGLKHVAQKRGLARERMPTVREVEDTGRFDLSRAIQVAGGSHAVAEKLQIQTQRRPRGYWRNFDTVVAEMRAYLEEQSVNRDKLPSQAQLYAEGRLDLRYALQVHGSHRVAAALGLEAHRGREWGVPNRAHEKLAKLVSLDTATAHTGDQPEHPS